VAGERTADGTGTPSAEDTPAGQDAAAPDTPAEQDTPTEQGAPAEQDAAEPPWWQDPRMPWSGPPTRSDLLCWAGIALSGVLTLATVPLRPVLLAQNPLALAALSGSRIVMVSLGALAAVGRMDLWWLGLVLGTLSVVKYDPLFWWAGRLWGRGLLRMVTGSASPRAARGAARAERLAARWGVPAILLTYAVPLVPSTIVSATVGAAGMSLRRFLLANLAGAFATRCLYMYLGYRIGQPVVDVLETVDRYLLWVSLGLVVVVVVSAARRARTPAA
jgi:membrane protein DedA with SNARE-associated domain